MAFATTLVFWGFTALIAGFGAYFGAYLKKKGENLATQEDIHKLVEQVRAVTQATKEIEANISDKSWNRQRHWEMKKEAVMSTVQTVLEAQDALRSLAGALSAEGENESAMLATMVGERAQKCKEAISSLDARRVLALVVCGRELDKALMAMSHNVRSAADKLADKDTKAYEELIPTIRKDFARVVYFARQELGADWKVAESQPSESSAAPIPDSPSPE